MQHSINLNLSGEDKFDRWKQVVDDSVEELKEGCGCINDDFFEFTLSSGEKDVGVKVKGFKMHRYTDALLHVDRKIEKMFHKIYRNR